MTTLFNSSSSDYGLNADSVDSAVYAMNSSDALVRDSSKQVTRYKAKGLRVIFRSTNDGSISSDPAAFVDALHNASPDADIYYIWNEVGLPDVLSPKTLNAMYRAETYGKKIVGFNVQTSQAVADWQKHIGAIDVLTKRGHFVGIHLYLDGTHDDGGYAPLDWLKSIGANVMVTEYAPIQSILDANKGWLAFLSPDQFNAWQDAHAAKVQAYGYPCFDFSTTDWPSGNDGLNTGFGTIRFPTIQQHFQILNRRYPLTQSSYPAGTNPSAKLVNLTAGLNLRSNPTTNASIITTLKYQTGVTVFAQPVVNADSYHWQRVVDNSGNRGWCANSVNGVASFADPPAPPDTPIHSVSVPFYSQNSPSANLRINDCLIACCRMMLGFVYPRQGITDPTYITVNDMTLHTPLASSDKPLTPLDGITLLSGYGMKAHSSTALDLLGIGAELAAGRPCILLVNDQYFGGTGVGHYVVAVAQGSYGFWVHDPDIEGASFYILDTNLNNALTQTSAFAGVPYQGIVVVG